MELQYDSLCTLHANFTLTCKLLVGILSLSQNITFPFIFPTHGYWVPIVMHNNIYNTVRSGLYVLCMQLLFVVGVLNTPLVLLLPDY